MMTNLILIRFITIMKKIFFISSAIVLAASCNKNIIGMSPVEECGYIDLGVTAETEMVITRGLVTEADLSGYNITLVKDNEVVEGWPKEFESINDADWKVPAGTYTIKVENLTVEETYKTDKGVVRVSGETSVTVTAGVSTSCTVACTPQNSKVSFMYSPEFDVVFDEPAVTVKESDTRSVAMTVGDSHLEENAAYFEVGSLTWTLTAELNGQTKTYSKDFSTVKAKWSQITFTTGSTDGQINVTITVDGEITETETITAVVDPFSGAVEVE